jgi:hypothetical protein
VQSNDDGMRVAVDVQRQGWRLRDGGHGQIIVFRLLIRRGC